MSLKKAAVGISLSPALCTALQAAEALKLLCGRSPSPERKLLLKDLLNTESDIMEL